MRFFASLAIAASVLLGSSLAMAGDFITVASTTSTANSGLFDDILPQFTKKTGIEVRVIAVGTGQAIRQAKAGDADVLFVHHRKSEEAFVAEGFGEKRYDVMMNDFIVIGPKADPAGVKSTKDVNAALTVISTAKANFVSRGDDSGTHKRERGLWTSAGLTPGGNWYREAGAGMGATLNMAQGMGAYALSDRGTWIAFKNKDGLDIVHEGSSNLANPYGVILVSKAKHPHVKSELGQTFIDWLVSKDGQHAIAAFKLQGEQLFFPTAQ
ncbi:substrate-binding domain-containing protein [Magnetovibrio sp. PR-2]|uniref:substrate-binding domain-containing protein n=1 Tax=Magnetovibrio sp. PR-2 TaxID=3120356 RepID=UPI002FCE24C8